MDHKQLRSFVASAETLHFAKAAKELGVPRSTVVADVRKLEEIVGAELFARDVESTQLTDAGSAFLIDARRQLDASAAAAAKSAPAPGGKAKANKGKGRAPKVKGEPLPYKKRQGR
ncbi:LysR family transcriptional regulator [Plantibacter sp. LMC-P-059a]|jgi:DNA-binding transcriptional LysR family regulator|uniref:LysR family transcriptional regulator n=1 Tax=Plantibacter sp. LMC-P-059a TaxID=3040297 RepID=UPI00254B885B|nr:LysR family transcriptional regulator [Plantibacter sp. LMC-P-059a]